MRRSPRRCFGTYTIALLAPLLPVAGDSPAAAQEPAAKRNAREAEVKLAEPLVYGADRVEVTEEGTLRRRYRVWGDWDAEVAAWLLQARENAARRGTPGRSLKIGCVFLKNARMTSTDLKGDDGRALEATYTTSPAFVDAMKTRGMKEFTDFLFAFSGGEVEVTWVVETVEDLHWTGPGAGWGCQPRAVGDQVLKALEPHKDDGIAMWMFCAGRPVTLNAKAPQRQFGAPPYGISYTQWPLYGGWSLVISQPDLGLMVHEFNHRYLDNLRAIEGVQLTLFHGLSALGLRDRDCGYPRLMNTYRCVYQHIVRRDMWRRFTLAADVNRTPRETFAGKAYVWGEAKHDCWFSLPELTDASLAQLTGIPSLAMDAPKGAAHRLYRVAPADRGKVLSPVLDGPDPDDRAPNNHLAIPHESCAALRTATGHWLFVNPQVADVNADMEILSGRGTSALPAYGYVNEGIQPIVVLKAPASLDVPPKERGYFGRAAAPATQAGP